MERLIVENHSALVHHRDLLRETSNAPARKPRDKFVSRFYQRLALRFANLLIAIGVKLQARYHEPLHSLRNQAISK